MGLRSDSPYVTPFNEPRQYLFYLLDVSRLEKHIPLERRRLLRVSHYVGYIGVQTRREQHYRQHSLSAYKC